ncbi:MAG TPA: hypothetical protein DDY70_02710, partial [Clostridiales bacterium]|nr:hypothetical protein [Clostridiales bacterium]
YLVGETVTVTVLPKAGYTVGAVTLNGNAFPMTSESDTFRLEKENLLSVTFEKDTRAAASVRIENTVGGALSLKDAKEDLRVGDTVTLVAAPSSRRYRLASVTHNGRPLTPGADGYTVTLEADNVFSASFDEIANARFIFNNDNEIGTLTLSEAEDPAYLVGDTVSVTVAIVRRGAAVSSFKVNGTEIRPENGVYRFTLAANNEISVTYGEAAEAHLTLDADRAFGRLTVSAPADGSRYLVGDTVRVTVSPDDGAVIDTITVNGAAVAHENGVFSLTLTGDTVISAKFGAGVMSDALLSSLQGVMRFRGTYLYDVMGSDEYDTTLMIDTVFAGEYIWQKEYDAATGEIYYDTVYGRENRRLALITHTSDNTILRSVSEAFYEDYYNPFDRLSASDFVYLGSGVFRLTDEAKKKAAASALTGWTESIDDFLVYTTDGAAVSVKFKTVKIRYSSEITYVSSYDFTIDERGTATVDRDRIEPYERTPEHDALEAALRAAMEAPAYTVRHRGHEVGYEEPEGGETRPGYGDTDYFVYVRRSDLIYDSYPGEAHGFKLLQSYVYPFDIDAAGNVVLRDPVNVSSIAELAANFTAFKVELFTCIGDGVYVLHNNSDASAIVGFFGEGYEKASYAYATDCRITLKNGVLSEIVFTYKTYGIEETVTLNYTFGELPEEADLDFENATKTSVLDPFKGQYKDGVGNFCHVDAEGFLLNGKEITGLVYNEDGGYFTARWEGKVVYIQKLTSRQLAIWSEDGTLNLQLTNIEEGEVTIPEDFRGTWEYHGIGADGKQYDDVFEIQTHLIRYNGNVLMLISYSASEGITAEAEGITYNFVLDGERLLITMVYENLDMEAFHVEKTKDSAGIEIPSEYIGYYLSADGSIRVIITYAGITVNGVPYTITKYAGLVGGFTGKLGSESNYIIQFYGIGTNVNMDKLVVGTQGDNATLDRVDAINEKYLGSWKSVEGEWRIRITETEIFINGEKIAFLFDPEYGYTFELPGYAYTIHLLYYTTAYGAECLALYDDDALLYNLFKTETVIEDELVGVFEGTKDGITYRLSVTRSGDITLTIGDGEPLVGTLTELTDVYLVFTADGHEYYFIYTSDTEYYLSREDDETVTLSRTSAVSIPSAFHGTWASSDGSCTLVITEGTVILSRDGNRTEAVNIGEEDGYLYFTVGDVNYLVETPENYGGASTAIMSEDYSFYKTLARQSA